MRKGFSALVLSGVLATGVVTTGCDTYSHPTPQLDKAQMKKNEYVYGEVDGPARQSKNTYPTNPDAAAKAADMKKKLYADDPGTMSKWNSKGTSNTTPSAAALPAAGGSADASKDQSAHPSPQANPPQGTAETQTLHK